MAKPALLREHQTFQMKGSLVPVSIVYLLDTDLNLFAQQLRERVEQAQGFFQYSPVIVDVSQLQKVAGRLDIGRVCQLLRELQLVPVALRGGGESERRAALNAGIGVLGEARQSQPVEELSKPVEPAPAPASQEMSLAAGPTLVVDQPVRSGQQIYARNADLVVLAGVSPGAELLADGNIHVYGALRGRVVAGAMGNTSARIFCATLQAELVSIAGCYQLAEDMPTTLLRRRVAIRLLGEDLHYDALE